MLNRNYRTMDTFAALPERERHTGLAPGDAVRAVDRREGGETGIVASGDRHHVTVHWTNGETTTVPRTEVQRIEEGEDQ